MATVKYYYRSPKENATLTVRLMYRYNGKDYIIGANSEILIYNREELLDNPNLSGKNYWNKQHNAQRLKDIDIINKKSELSTTLNRLENHILQSFSFISPEQANREWLQGIIYEFHNPNKADEAPNTLIEFIDFYLKMNTNLKYGTSKKFITLKNKIITRKNELTRGGIILLSEINDNFRIKYQKIFSDYNTNTINRDLTNIKTLLRYAENKGKDINKEALNWKLKVDKTPFVYLNDEEIQRIYELKNLSEHLENAKDWLVISCLCGQRVSDFMRFKKEMISKTKNVRGEEVMIIELIQVKTGTIVTLPLHKTILEILDKRSGNFPRPISSQKYNDYIKEVCKEAKLIEKVYGSKAVVNKLGVKRNEYGTFEKWELIASHVGRRSFATNRFGNVPTSLIMSATGHSSEKMFLAYIQKTQRDQALSLADYF
jgi:integrase